MKPKTDMDIFKRLMEFLDSLKYMVYYRTSIKYLSIFVFNEITKYHKINKYRPSTQIMVMVLAAPMKNSNQYVFLFSNQHLSMIFSFRSWMWLVFSPLKQHNKNVVPSLPLIQTFEEASCSYLYIQETFTSGKWFHCYKYKMHSSFRLKS